MLSRKLDISCEEEVWSSAELYYKVLNCIEAQKHLDVWEVSEALIPMKTFMPHSLVHLRT